MLMGLNGMAYTSFWNDKVKELKRLKQNDIHPYPKGRVS